MLSRLQICDGAHEVVVQVCLSNLKALKLLHGALLLLSASTCCLEGLVFCFYASDLALNFLFPTVTLLVKSLVGALLVPSDLIKFGLLLYLQYALLYGLAQEHV